MSELASTLNDPQFLPFELDLDSDRLLLLKLNLQQRTEASFLDQRAVDASTPGAWVPIQAALGMTSEKERPPLDFIFHIGHCGSTLLTRLLQSWPQIQVLREPLPLRTLAGAQQLDARNKQILAFLCGMWARCPAGAARTVIKATSSCNALAVDLLGTSSNTRAILMDAPLRHYLATILKSEGSIADAAAAWPDRARVLASYGVALDPGLASGNPVLPIAAGWLAEQKRFEALKLELGDRVLRIDFDQLLREPGAVLQRVAAHFQLARDGVEHALSSPFWRRYSKSVDHAYDAADREHDLRIVETRFGHLIDGAERWVDLQSQG